MSSNGGTPRYLGIHDGRPLSNRTTKLILIVGATGLGKTTHYFSPNILLDTGSLIASEITGEQAMICGAERLKRGKVVVDNAYGVLPEALAHLPNGGCNQVAGLDPAKKNFSYLSEKLATGCAVKDPDARDKYFSNSGRQGIKATIMDHSLRGENANIAEVAEVIHGDFQEYAKEVCARSKNRHVKAILRRFIDQGKEIRSINEVIEQMRTDMGFLLDDSIAKQISRDDYQPRDARKEVMTIFNLMPIDAVEVAEKYLKLQLSHTLSELINPDIKGNKQVTIYVEEYGLVGKNGLDAVAAAIGTSRKFNVSFFLSVTCLEELQAIHKDWESMIANAGATIWMLPIFDRTTSEYLSKLCGDKDIYTGSISSSPGPNKPPGSNFSHAGRRVFTPAELAAMDEDEAIVFTDFSKGRPIVVKHKPYWELTELLKGKKVGKNIYYDRG